MAENDPYVVGNFYIGSPFITTELTQTFGELGIDRRVSIIVDIDARPQVSHIVMQHTTGIIPQPTNLASLYHYFHVTSGGTIQRSIAPVQFTDRTDQYITRWPPPACLVFYDQNLNYRYVTTSTGVGTWVSSGTEPTNFNIDRAQFVGSYVEMIGADGISVYRITVSSSNTISCTLNRVEPERAATIRVQQGRRFGFDGTYVYVPALAELGDSNMSMSRQDYGYGGVSVSRLGDLSLYLGDSEFDYLIDQSWDTRGITVRVGISDQEISEHKIVMRGKTERAEADLDRIRIVMRDQGLLFDRSIQSRTYPGTTGGYNGTSDLTGVLKPLLYGFRTHIAPVLLDSVRQTYQIHDGPIHQIFSIHEGGALHTSIGDITANGFENLNFWNPTATQVSQAVYMTDLSRGCFKMAAPPVRPLSVVAQGHTSIPFGNSQIGYIVDTIISTKVPEASIDRNALDEFLTDQIGSAGLYITDETTIRDALEELIAPVQAFLDLDNQNRVIVGRVKAGVPVAFLQGNGMMESGIGTQALPYTPGSQYKIGYAKSGVVFTDSDFLDNASSVIVNTFLKNEYRYQTITMSGVGTTRLPTWSSAKTIEINTAIGNAVVAGEIAVRIAHLAHAMQRLYKCTVRGYAYQIQIGDTVMLQIEQLGINSNIKTGIVVEVTDKAPTDSREDETDLLILAT